MNRGWLSFVGKNKAYKSAVKEWVVELQQYHSYWYDLVVNPIEIAEGSDTTRDMVVEYLKQVKASVEANLEKRFIYFICSRRKVRFDVSRKHSYNPFTKTTKIHLLIDGETRRSIKVLFASSSGHSYKPMIRIEDKYITILNEAGIQLTYSVHDFLKDAQIDLGISSNVEYVGYTKNPHTRPTNGAHTGLSDVLYRTNDRFDTLIYFNLFKVLARTLDSNHQLKFIVANAMTDEVDVELEGKILEKCLMFYFDSDNQNRNKLNDYSELKENLTHLETRYKIRSIDFNYEFENSSDYGCFSSSKVRPSRSHQFVVRLVDGDIKITRSATRAGSALPLPT